MSKSVSLLISILVRYPEVGSLHYDPQAQHLRFTFLLTRALTDAEFEATRQKTVQSLEALAYLENRSAGDCRMDRTPLGDHQTMITIQRDVGTLSLEEIALVIALMRSEFPQKLVVDPGDSLYEDEAVMQEELIEQMLEDVRDVSSERRLVAFREEGRVMVFNQ